MAFWGVEVKPGKPFTLKSEDLVGSLIVTQATLGHGSSSKRSILQVRVGDKTPIFLCSLLPDKSECFTLNLEFAEEEDVVFSVVGSTSIHVSGYVQRPEHDDENCEMDCCGEDIAETESEDSEFESEDDYDDDFIVDEYDDDMPTLPPSTAHSRGVVIEEIDDADKLVSKKGGNKQAKKKKKKELPVATDCDKIAQQQIAAKGKIGALELESEDEDGFPVSSSSNGKSSFSELQKANMGSKTADKGKNDAKSDGKSSTDLKRKVDAMDQDQVPNSDANDSVDGDASEDKKKKNKKKKKKAKIEKDETVADMKQNDSEVANVRQDQDKQDQKLSTVVEEAIQSDDKPAKARTYSNGLVVEEMQMGKPNGKRASLGKKVSVHYIGKLKKTGKIFDSNTNGSTYDFRLGVGQVIKGWDVGVEGMRVGDKRRLTIPPEMGYGSSGLPHPQIPPNAWLVYDVELVDVV